MVIPQKEIGRLPASVRKIFLKWCDLLYGRVRFNREESPIHARAHCERVLLFGLLTGERIWGDDERMLTQIAQAAVFHDTRRDDDALDTGHGARAAVYYKEFCSENPDVTFYPEVVYMIRYHDLSDRMGRRAIMDEFIEKASTVLRQYEIFKDADALDRWRLGRRGLDQKYLRTDAARELVDYARKVVKKTVDPELPANVEKRVDEACDRLGGRNLLIIVDPQYDFVTGTLPVAGAVKALDSLAEFLRISDGVYCCKIVTADRHPYDHCSFRQHGGEWPRHCVRDSQGAAVWDALLAPLYETKGKVRFMYKGQDREREEYSIFQNHEAAEAIRSIVTVGKIEKIEICGLAGDVCVRETVFDAIKLFGADMVNVLAEFSPSLDGGTALAAIKERYGV